MDDLGISAAELQTLLQITHCSALAESGQQLDVIIAAVQSLVPFTQCVVLHERPQQSHMLAFVHQRAAGLEKKVGSTWDGDQPLQISQYLQSFSRFGTFQNAFFWFLRERPVSHDRGVANVLQHAALTEGVAGGINVAARKNRRSATLVLLQYCQLQFAPKHLVFANLIASGLHDYFQQGEVAPAKSHGRGWHSNACASQFRSTLRPMAH